MANMVEIDEEELLKQRRTISTVNEMFKNGKAKRKLLEALKEVRPDDPAVKELETPDPVDDRFAALEKQNAELKKALETDKTERENQARAAAFQTAQEKGFERLRAERWTEDGIAKVKKVMDEQGILDVDIAAAWIEKQNPPQNPMNPGSGPSWNFMDMPSDDTNKDYKRLMDTKGEDDSVLRKLAHEAISEVRGGTRR